MTLSYVEKRYWKRVMFADESVAALAKDGLMYMFEPEHAKSFLIKYPHVGQVWYFNETRDRECAELCGDRVFVNPMIVSSELGLPVIFE